MKTTTITRFFLLALPVLMITACTRTKPLASYSSANVYTTHAAVSPGDFVVRLTDSPGDFSELRVEIVKIEAFQDNRGWVTLNNEPQEVDVLALTNGKQITLAKTPGMNIGSYTKLKLTFGDENYVKFNPGVELAHVGLNAGGEARLSMEGIRETEIDINHEVDAGSGAHVLLDFNVAQSIVQRANQYVLQPVITEIEDVTTGIQGNLENATVAAIIVTDGVYNYSTYTNADGQFLLRGIDPGTYDIVVVPAGQDMNGKTEHRIEGIQIKDGEITQMGKIHL